MLKLLLPNAAVLVNTGKSKVLIITDTHIGWEKELEKKGIHVPSQTTKILSKLVKLLNEYEPDKLVILGDIKYSVASNEVGERRDIPNFFKTLQRYVSEVAVVRGNHDGNLETLLPEGVEFLGASGVKIGDVGVFHGHKWPSPELLGCKSLIMGHLHPVVVFRDPTGCRVTRQVWMKTTVNPEFLAQFLLGKSGVKISGSLETTLQNDFGVKLKTNTLLVMPSFNDFLGGRPINEVYSTGEAAAEGFIGPVLRSQAVNVEVAEVYLLDGTYLGTLSQLKRL